MSLSHLDLRVALQAAAWKAVDARQQHGPTSKEYRYARAAATRARNRLSKALDQDDPVSLRVAVAPPGDDESTKIPQKRNADDARG